jgi:uncharacterized protein (TIGR03437 family)
MLVLALTALTSAAHAQFTAETIFPTNVGSTSATLNGAVNTQGTLSQCQFQINPGTGFTINSPMIPVPGNSAVSIVSLDQSGFSPGANIFYQILCSQGSGVPLAGGFRSVATSNVTPPSFTASSVVSGGLPKIAGLSPGQVTTIYGSSLATGTGTALPDPALPMALAGASVSFNGLPGSLSYSSPQQINVQAPFGLPVGEVVPVTVTVDYGGGFSLSSTVEVPVSAMNPSIAGYADFSGHDLSQPGSSLPVGSPGFTIWVLGLGEVNGFGTSGMPAPLSPLFSTAVVPSVTVDNEPAEVSFSGLAPGGVGLYQVNVLWTAVSGAHIVVVDGVASFAVTVK